MVDVDTYIYFGGQHINGGPIGTNTGLNIPESFWGIGRNMPKLNRVCPSGPDGVFGGVYNPYWDGTYGGTGARVPFHYMDNTIIPGARGDNWYYTGGGITPCSLLMQSLFDQYGNVTPGFRMIKHGGAGGVRSWLSSIPSGNWSALMTDWTGLSAAESGDGNTPVIKACIIDTSDEDINRQTSPTGPDLLYETNMRAVIAQVRAQWGNDFPIVIVTPHPFTWKTLLPPIAPAIRAINEKIAQDTPNIILFDMSWGQFAPDTKGLGVESVNPVYFQPETYLQAGLGIYNRIRAFYTAEPIPDPTQPIAGLLVVGDSQLVTAGMNPLAVFYGNQESLLGPDPLSTLLPNVYIWNETAQDVVQYDVLTNSAGFGSISTQFFGPDLTFARGMLSRFPNGILVFKFAKGSMSLTPESVAAGAQGGSLMGALGEIEVSMKPSWSKCRQVVAQKFNRSLSMVGGLISIGENDLFTTATLDAYDIQVLELIDILREIFTTDLTGGVLPLIFLQGPPPYEDNTKGSKLGIAANRRRYRETVKNIPLQKSRVTILINDDGRYETDKGEKVHYGLEAVLDIGDDASTGLIALIDSDEGETEATTTEVVDVPSSSAAFIVESGSGDADANAFIDVDFADTYLRTFGNPTLWFAASQSKKKDAIRLMSRWLTLKKNWSGTKKGATQGLAFPRFGLYDGDGYALPSDAVPQRIKEATAYGAYRMVKGDWDPFPDMEANSGASSESISVGGISFSISGSGTLAKDQETVLTLVNDLIRPLLKKSSARFLGRG